LKLVFGTGSMDRMYIPLYPRALKRGIGVQAGAGGRRGIRGGVRDEVCPILRGDICLIELIPREVWQAFHRQEFGGALCFVQSKG
jgi:hypothetical protein